MSEIPADRTPGAPASEKEPREEATSRVGDPAGADGAADVAAAHSEDHESGQEPDAESALRAFEASGSEDALERVLDALDRVDVAEHANVCDRLRGRLRRALDENPSSLPAGLAESAARHSEGQP